MQLLLVSLLALACVLFATAPGVKAVRRASSEELTGKETFPPRAAPHCKVFKPYIVVVAGTRHDSRWLHTLKPDIGGLVYQQEDPERAHYYSRHGNEVGAYLQFLYDYYDCLPNVTAFVHGHEEEGWHNFNMHDTLTSLQWERVPGYTDLNRKVDIWDVQLRDRPKYPSDHPIATGEEVFSGKYDPQTIMGGNAYDPTETFHWMQQEANARAYDKFFGFHLGPMPWRVNFVCCSQFAVTRETIRSRPRSFYEENLHYMRNNDIQASNLKPKEFVVGDIWTIYWPMIFGESADYQRRVPDHELFSG